MGLMVTLRDLKHHAIASSLFPATTLKGAVSKLGFVQADPIRAPARAQDLILRQHVTDYRADDIDRKYRALKLEEDILYAYGFMPAETWRLLPVRRAAGVIRCRAESARYGIPQQAPAPQRPGSQPGERARDQRLGRLLEINHARSRRAALPRPDTDCGANQGDQALPASGSPAGSTRPGRAAAAARAADCRHPRTGAARQSDGGCPASALHRTGFAGKKEHRCRAAQVRRVGERGGGWSSVISGRPVAWYARRRRTAFAFLAPFDPLVWDRRRFELFWGWPYRFEAYTPPAKRKLGYYALPLLWRAEVIGWVNAAKRGTDLSIEAGYVNGKPPAEKAFHRAFEAESQSLRYFLESAD